MELNFDSGFFVENRRKLREACGQDLIIIAAHGLLQKTRDEAYPFRQESNFWYLTGVDEPDFVLVMDKDQDYLIAPPRSEYLRVFSGEIDHEEIKQSSGVANILEYTAGWRKLGASLKQAKAVATLKPLPAYIEQVGFYTNPADKALIEKIGEHKDKLKLMDIRLVLAHLRSVKTDGELRCIQRATDESVRLHEQIAANLKQFKTERDVLAFVKTQAVEKGLELAYGPITASGKNAAVLHYENGQDALKPGEPVLVDAAYSYLSYGSDITRTYCAQPSKRYKQIQDAVIEVQKYAIGLLKPGITLREYEQPVEKFMGGQLKKLGLIKKTDEKSIDEYYPHKTSHFIGLDAHDAGDPDMPLVPGMVLSVEPGIYVPDESIGVRIEDIALITEKDAKILSARLPKNTDVS